MATLRPPQSAHRVLAGLFLLALGGCAPAADAGAIPSTSTVRPGIDVLLSDSLHVVAGRRVGLITNPTGLGADGTSTIDLLRGADGVELVRLFAPEHGLRAAEGEGRLIEDGFDPASGLPVVSLYASGKRQPEPADLDGLDALLFDMQDVGARYYTYVYTMALAMEAAGRAGIPFVVLDRPNPIGGGPVQGNVLDPAFSTFVGMYAIPMRHGMTPGELARLFAADFGVAVDLRVIPVAGWSRSMSFEATGLPWIAPSPNMPSVTSALHYPGLCLFEGTGLSVGRGTDAPFQQVGAPWIDGPALAAALEAYGLPGVRFDAVRFTPTSPSDGKFDGVELGGVRAVATDPDLYDPTRAAVAVLVEAFRQAGSLADSPPGAPDGASPWEWNAAHFDRLAGTDALRLGIEQGLDADELTVSWTDQLAAFAPLRERALIY